MTRTRRIDHSEVHRLAAAQVGDAEIARQVGGSPGYIRLIRTGQVGGECRESRKTPRSLSGKAVSIPAFDHPAVKEGRTLYPSTVVDAGDFEHDVLKSGFNSAKIGREIRKGHWKGLPIYTLTLEERATCPRSCRHFRSCFGNGMPQAHRFRHDSDFELRLVEEVAALGRRHRRGFAVRLHVLGDFYSVEYVKLWAELLRQVPQLHVFGFSARWDADRDPIARALVELVIANWDDRFRIRFSNAPVDECSTVSVEHPGQVPAFATLCPQQTGRVRNCGNCALCWESKRPISFLQH